MAFRWDKRVETVDVTIPTCDRCGKDLSVLDQQQRTADRKYAGVVLTLVPSAWPDEARGRLDQAGDREDRLESKPLGRGERAADLCQPCADEIYEFLTQLGREPLIGPAQKLPPRRKTCEADPPE